MVGLTVLVVLFIVYAVFSRRMERSPITGPIVFTAAGLLAGLELIGGGTAIETLELGLESEVIQGFLEATLAVILFSDAVMIDTPAVRREAFLPGRLLGIGLPLTILVGTLAVFPILPGVSFWPAVVLAVVLAPTDAALGQAVVANPGVPGTVRQGLVVESGLNDGMVVPALAVALAAAAGEMQSAGEIVGVFVEEIGLAVVVGVAVGWVGAKVVRWSSERGWMAREGRQVILLFLAFLCYLAADPVGGSGFIAAFVGGLTFGYQLRRVYPDMSHFSEGVGHLMTMFAFFIFGGLVLAPYIEVVTWRIVLYAVVSLTVVRMIPVAISLIGTGLSIPTQMYVGWFGPRGLASLVFLGTVVVQAAPDDAPEIIATGATAVGLSVLLHGLTAWPLSQWYAAWWAREKDTGTAEGMAEAHAAEHIPTRRLEGRMRPPME